MFVASQVLIVIPLLIHDPLDSLCSQQFLEAFPVEALAIVFCMCISYMVYIPIMQDEVCTDSQPFMAFTTELINAARMNRFILLFMPTAY